MYQYVLHALLRDHCFLFRDIIDFIHISSKKFVNTISKCETIPFEISTASFGI